MVIRTLDWHAYIGKEVLIYRNLHNHRLSIKAQVRNEQGKLQWRVVGHIADALIRGVVFHLSEASRQRAIADREQNVHAWGRGVLLGWQHRYIDAPIGLTYNYQRHSTFIERDSQCPIFSCVYLVVRDNQVWCSPDALIGGGGSVIVHSGRKKRRQLNQVNLLELDAEG